MLFRYFFVAEQYLGKALSPIEINKLLYFYDELHFSTDLMEYLIEYCVSKGSHSIRYIETVALSWADRISQLLNRQRRQPLHTTKITLRFCARLGLKTEIRLMKKSAT